MYKKNKWDSSEFKDFYTLQFSCNLKVIYQVIDYYYYTQRLYII